MSEIIVPVTIVFAKTWEAINQMAYDADGKPVFDENGKHLRKYRYIIHKGSSRSSKTRSLIQTFYRYANANNGKRLSVWRHTKKICKDTVGFDMLKCFGTFPTYHTSYFNKSESYFTFPTSSRIEIRGADNEEEVMGYNGDVTWLNEPYSISRETFDQIDQRTEDFVVLDLNPKQAHFTEDLEKDPRTLVIHSTFKDNPYCPAEQKRKILSYQPVKMTQVVNDGILTENDAKEYNLTENHKELSERQIKELARCKENERKGSASAFNWSVYGLGIKAEKPNRIFSWEEISDDEYNKINVTRYYGTDWGSVDPWGIVEAKYYDGALYLKELNYASENEIRGRLSPTEIQQVENMDEGLVRWVFERLSIPKNAINVCDDNRPLKVRALREAGYDYAITAHKPPGSVLDGISLLENLKVYYTSSSKNIAYEQENYERKVDRYGLVCEDEPEDRDNHLIDPTRYIATYLQVSGVIRKI